MQITDLYQTKITCSTYNANIDSTDTVITVKLIDFNGNAVTNKSVTLTCDKGYFNKKNSTSISGTTTKSITLTTNSSGEITGTWTASEWGLCTFSTNNSNAQINVEGFKTIREETTNIIRFNGEKVQIRISQSSNAGLPKTYSYTTIPSDYRPVYSVSCPVAGITDNGELYGYIRAQHDGSLALILSKQTYNASTGGLTVFGTLEYTI